MLLEKALKIDLYCPAIAKDCCWAASFQAAIHPSFSLLKMNHGWNIKLCQHWTTPAWGGGRGNFCLVGCKGPITNKPVTLQGHVKNLRQGRRLKIFISSIKCLDPLHLQLPLLIPWDKQFGSTVSHGHLVNYSYKKFCIHSPQTPESAQSSLPF